MPADSPEVLQERAVSEIEAASQSLPNLTTGEQVAVDRQLAVLQARCASLSGQQFIARAIAALDEPIAVLRQQPGGDRPRVVGRLVELRRQLDARLSPGGAPPRTNRRNLLAWLAAGLAAVVGYGVWYKTAGPGGPLSAPPPGSDVPLPVPDDALTLGDAPLVFRTAPGSLQVGGQPLNAGDETRIGPVTLRRTNDTTLTIAAARPRPAGVTTVPILTSAGPRRLLLSHQAAEAVSEPLVPPPESLTLGEIPLEVTVAAGDLKIAGRQTAVGQSVVVAPLTIQRTTDTKLSITGARPRSAGSTDVALDTQAGPRRLRVGYQAATALPTPESTDWPKSFFVPKDFTGLPAEATLKVAGRGPPQEIAKNASVVLDPLKLARSADGTILAIAMNRPARSGEIKLAITVTVDSVARTMNAVFPT